jgi:myo-inositol-1(or 4)-monophosphatase
MPQGDGCYWLVDPIDGTVNFANGLPYFAISVGLWDGRCFPVGAVSMPAFKELYFTQGEEGAFLNGQRLNVEPAVIDQALIGAGLPSRAEDREQYDTFGRVNEATRGCLRLGSAASLVCLVACGRLQGAYGVAVKMWDVAGALAVARQAGADVSIRYTGSEPIIDFVAAAPGIGGPLRELLGSGLSGGWQ